MTLANRLRTQQRLRQAEGYLELGMPQHALDVLDDVNDAGPSCGRLSLLQGYALRALGRYVEAIYPLVAASETNPNDIHVWLALGWCYKRIQRLDLAIESLEHALEAAPDQALIHYNLSCYWSLARNKERTLEYLARALELDADYRDLIPQESDFDALRDDPDFRSLITLEV
ncbi:MAG: tetratricopeptide repeat protein [Planctomycetia bacterium]|nr:tetratricopeptide repeat protein [Planctomycetia bacterium]